MSDSIPVTEMKTAPPAVDTTKPVTGPPKQPAVKKGSTMKPIVENLKIPLTNISLPESWNRDKGRNINSLVTSLKAVGQLVAVVVKPDPKKEGKYILVDGRRRYMAMKEAKIKDVIATITTSDVTDTAIGLTANLNREGHTPLELARTFKQLTDEGMSNQEIAAMHGRTSGFISQHIKLLKLPDQAREAIDKNYLSLSQARALLRLDLTKTPHVKKFERFYTKAIDGTPAQEIEDGIGNFITKEKEKQAAEAPKGKEVGKKKNTKNVSKTTKGRGRPPKVKDYADVKDKIKPLSKTELLDCLTSTEERRARTSSKSVLKYLEGKRDGLEVAARLRE